MTLNVVLKSYLVKESSRYVGVVYGLFHTSNRSHGSRIEEEEESSELV